MEGHNAVEVRKEEDMAGSLGVVYPSAPVARSTGVGKVDEEDIPVADMDEIGRALEAAEDGSPEEDNKGVVGD